MTDDAIDNPFEAPRADVDALRTVIETPKVAVSAEVEAIRMAHLRLETSVKSVAGCGFLLGETFLAIALPTALALARWLIHGQVVSTDSMLPTVVGSSVLVFWILLSVGVGTLAVGLHGFHAWARRPAILAVRSSLLVLVASVGLLAFILFRNHPRNLLDGLAFPVLIIPAWIIAYSLRTLRKQEVVRILSREYRDVVSATPHIRSRMNIFIILSYIFVFHQGVMLTKSFLSRSGEFL